MKRYFVKFLSLLITKIASQVNILYDIRLMQRNLVKLIAWANRCNMDFSTKKWEKMLIRKRNLKFQYQMKDGWVNSVDEERNLEC